jgi:ATP-binding cassette, subfamily C, bacterial
MKIHFLHTLWNEAPKRAIFWLIPLLMLSSLTEGLGLLLLVPFLDILQSEQMHMQGIGENLKIIFNALHLQATFATLLCVFIALIGLRSIVTYLRDKQHAFIQSQWIDCIRVRCYDGLLHAQLSWTLNKKQSDHMHVLLTSTQRIGSGIHAGLQLVAGFFIVIAYLVVAFTLSWVMTSIAVASGVLILLTLSGQQKKAFELGTSFNAASKQMQSVVLDSLQGMKIGKILGNHNLFFKHYETIIQRIRSQQLQFTGNISGSRSLFQFGGAVFLAGYIYFGVTQFQIPIAQLLILIFIFSRLMPMFAMLQQHYHQWVYAVPAMEEVWHYIQDCKAHEEKSLWTPHKTESLQIEKAIELSNITVRYRGRSHPVLNNFSMVLMPCTTTIVTGSSGSGKSTLADVLMTLLIPDEGDVFIDGVVMTDARRCEWRRSVSYVPQDVFLLNDSIRNNLLWAKPLASDVELQAILRCVAAEFVFDLAQGLDTVVGDRGSFLSGGERQRLALARALLRQPALLILDEATNALDLESESRICQTIEDLHGSITIVLITHHPEIIKKVDQIIVLPKVSSVEYLNEA